MSTLTAAPDFEAIRARLRRQHDAGLSWQKLADTTGLTKGELYAFAMKGHTPRADRIVAVLRKLQGLTFVRGHTRRRHHA